MVWPFLPCPNLKEICFGLSNEKQISVPFPPLERERERGGNILYSEFWLFGI